MRITLRFANARVSNKQSIALSQIRAGIFAVAGAHSPPLEPMDVLGLAVEALAKQVFNRRIPDGAISVDETLRPLRQALCAVLQAAPDAAQRAGLLSDLQTITITKVEDAFAKFLKWAITVLQPAVREFIYLPRNLDTGKRIDLVVHQWGIIQESAAQRADPERLRDIMRAELGRTLGEKEVGPEELERPHLHGWVQLLIGAAGPDARLIEVRAGEIVVNRKCLRATLDGHIGAGKRVSGKVTMSLDAVPREDRQDNWKPQQSREVDPRAELARRDLRDQRDALDEHRLLQSLVDKALDRGELPSIDELADRIAALRSILGQVRDRALVAAIVFTLCRDGRRGKHGVWTKDQVADEYQVSARQIDARLEFAEALVSKALRRRA